MRRLVLAVGVAVSAASVQAQLPPEIWFSPCGGPVATCMSPRVNHRLDMILVAGSGRDETSNRPVCDERIAALFGDETAGKGQSPYFGIDHLDEEPLRLKPIADDAREILDRWEIASQDFSPVTMAERLRLRYAFPGRTGQAVALTCELQEPVAAKELLRRYEWSVTGEGRHEVELTAVPRDHLERLFYGQFRVMLDTATWQPVSLSFPSAGGSGSLVALHPLDITIDDVQLVGFESGQNTARPVRTADLSDESPHSESDQPRIEPPPAPAPCRLDFPRQPVEAERPASHGEPAVLREVLEKFDRNYASAARVELDLVMWSCERTFEIETHGSVDVYLEDHTRGWWEVRPLPADAELASLQDGFQQQSVDGCGWRWDSEILTQYDPASNVAQQSCRRVQRTGQEILFERFAAAMSTPNIVFPVWAEASAESLCQRFEMVLAEYPDPSLVYIVASPRPDGDWASYQQIHILLDRATGRPHATSVRDPSGNRETVYMARTITIDGDRLPVKALKPREH